METLGFPGRQGCKLLSGMSTALQLRRSQEAGHPSQGKYCSRPKNTFMETEVHTGLETAKLGSCFFFCCCCFLFPLENLKHGEEKSTDEKSGDPYGCCKMRFVNGSFLLLVLLAC